MIWALPCWASNPSSSCITPTIIFTFCHDVTANVSKLTLACDTLTCLASTLKLLVVKPSTYLAKTQTPRARRADAASCIVRLVLLRAVCRILVSVKTNFQVPSPSTMMRCGGTRRRVALVASSLTLSRPWHQDMRCCQHFW